jgi:hypothetical protein
MAGERIALVAAVKRLRGLSDSMWSLSGSGRTGQHGDERDVKVVGTRTTQAASKRDEGVTMSALTGRQWAASCAGITGLLVAWAGGFLLSSGNSLCIDGTETARCSGSFASTTWHGVGAVSVIVGLLIVIAAVGFAIHAHRQDRSTQS